MPERTPRVLVVDDEAVIRQLIVINLELEGFEVHQAVDGLDAIGTAREVDPDVVTLDVMMPGLDGWATAQRLRSDPATSRARIVLISARTRPADVERGQDSGADAYVTKPFDPDEVVRAVRRLAVEAIAGERPVDAPMGDEPADDATGGGRLTSDASAASAVPPAAEGHAADG
ncbi:MAG TPA: response regulator [Mycobacteriales bacterium]